MARKSLTMPNAKEGNNKLYESIEPYLLVAPALGILLAFLIFPLFWNIYISSHDVSLTTILKEEWRFVGFENFFTLLVDPNLHTSLKITLAFVVGSVILQFGIGMIIAVMLNQQIRGAGILRAVFIIPWIVSSVIAGFSFRFIFNDNFGILNYILTTIMGMQPIGWLSDSNVAIWSIVIANTWYGAPFTILFLTAGLLSINPTIYEAALIDGATRLRRFFHITLPLLRPFIVINLILITMWSVNFFDLQFVMTGGGPLFASTTTSLYMYRQAFEFGLLSKGAATGILLLAMNLVLAFIYIKLLKR